jgi:hypothetical protein
MCTLEMLSGSEGEGGPEDRNAVATAAAYVALWGYNDGGTDADMTRFVANVVARGQLPPMSEDDTNDGSPTERALWGAYRELNVNRQRVCTRETFVVSPGGEEPLMATLYTRLRTGSVTLASMRFNGSELLVLGIGRLADSTWVVGFHSPAALRDTGAAHWLYTMRHKTYGTLSPQHLVVSISAIEPSRTQRCGSPYPNVSPCVHRYEPSKPPVFHPELHTNAVWLSAFTASVAVQHIVSMFRV